MKILRKTKEDKNTTEDIKFDDLGKYVYPTQHPVPIYDFKAMTEYCKKFNKEKHELTDEEYDMFTLYWS